MIEHQIEVPKPERASWRSAYFRTYANYCLPDVQRRMALLEKLRAKWRYHEDDVRFMQRLGDWGRTHFPFIGRGGWNGIGGGRL